MSRYLLASRTVLSAESGDAACVAEFAQAAGLERRPLPSSGPDFGRPRPSMYSVPSCWWSSGRVPLSGTPDGRRLGVLLAMVTYFDRACIAKLAPDTMRDLSLSKNQMSYVYSSFAIAYAIFEIPTAAWADRVGTRFLLTRIVVWWSSFTIFTAAVFNFASLVVVRFLFGIGEAGAWPSAARTLSQWIPRRERGAVQGIFFAFAGAHLSGGLTPLLVWFLTDRRNWIALGRRLASLLSGRSVRALESTQPNGS